MGVLARPVEFIEPFGPARDKTPWKLSCQSYKLHTQVGR